MEKPIINPLEQFVLLAKTAKGAAAVELIKQVLEATGVYVFGELLDMPNIKDLQTSQFSAYYNLLSLFAYGTCSDYRSNKEQLPTLTAVQLNKLRQLTIVSMATKNKCLPYTQLLTELEVSNLRELEDLIIEVIYADVIRGKLDQKKQQLEVDYAIGRDIRSEFIPQMVHVLREWCQGCEALLGTIEEQVKKANDQKEAHIELTKKVEQDVVDVKKTLKTTQQHDMEEQMVMDIPRDLATSSEKMNKKPAKTRGLRGSNMNARPSK